jgi:hypothetical protein
MAAKDKKYKAMVSSDWSECLSPNGPFDPIAFNYAHLAADLSGIFRDYTGNRISLTAAGASIAEMLAQPVSEEQMDNYLDACFKTYTRVPDLIEWCLARDIFFMINTTGTQGYFQRAVAKRLLPDVPAIAANPLIRFPGVERDARFGQLVLEIPDKAKCTEVVLRSLGLSPRRLIVMGDSGGDGPHFQWAGAAGAFLIGSMTKRSLEEYCRSTATIINRRFGLAYGPGEERDPEKEMEIDFMGLAEIIDQALHSM